MQKVRGGVVDRLGNEQTVADGGLMRQPSGLGVATTPNSRLWRLYFRGARHDCFSLLPLPSRSARVMLNMPAPHLCGTCVYYLTVTS
jgi:hypothetical protein